MFNLTFQTLPFIRNQQDVYLRHEKRIENVNNLVHWCRGTYHIKKKAIYLLEPICTII